jgi:hypothetical protein
MSTADPEPIESPPDPPPFEPDPALVETSYRGLDESEIEHR